MPTPAFPQDHSPITTRQLDVDGKKIPYLNQLAWCAIATLTGLPATVAPIGKTDGGCPVGVQIIGGYMQDRTTIGLPNSLSGSSAASIDRQISSQPGEEKPDEASH